MAATEPVTPSNTLAMACLPMLRFDRIEQSGRQVGPGNALVAACRTQVGPFGRAVEGVRGHPIGVRLLARLFGDGKQLLVADTDLQLELHEDAEIGRAH